MDFTVFIEWLKDFVWDILGYLLPGLFILVLSSVVVKPEYFVSSPIVVFKPELYPLIFFIVCYTLGFLTHGLSLIWDKLFSIKWLNWMGLNLVERTTSKLLEKAEFIYAKQLIETKLNEQKVDTTKVQLDISGVRNVILSNQPEMVKTVYMFIFRSEFANRIGIVCLTVGLFGLIDFFIKRLDLFQSDFKYLILYVLLLISYFALRMVRARFYEIAMKIPLSEILGKSIKLQ